MHTTVPKKTNSNLLIITILPWKLPKGHNSNWSRGGTHKDKRLQSKVNSRAELKKVYQV